MLTTHTNLPQVQFFQGASCDLSKCHVQHITATNILHMQALVVAQEMAEFELQDHWHRCETLIWIQGRLWDLCGHVRVYVSWEHGQKNLQQAISNWASQKSEWDAVIWLLYLAVKIRFLHLEEDTHASIFQAESEVSFLQASLLNIRRSTLHASKQVYQHVSV